MAICGLALIGTACAVGYRDMFGGSATRRPPTIGAINEPNRTPPAPASRKPKAAAMRASRPATTGSIDNMVSREEQPGRRLGPQKPPRVLRCPGRARLRRRPPVRRYRTKRCREKRWLRILLGLVQPSPLRRSAPENRMRRTSQLRRTTSIWLTPQSQPMRTALRRSPLLLWGVVMRSKLRLSAAKEGLKLRFGHCKRNTPISSTASTDHSSRRSRRCGHLLSSSCRSLRVSRKGRQVVQRIKGRRRRLHHSETLSRQLIVPVDAGGSRVRGRPLKSTRRAVSACHPE